ncbi:MAG: M20/M25/M40 family metallo-hydrolase [Candidatus Amulumruptor sp.]
MLDDAIDLLQQMIATPSVSRDEAAVATLIYDRFVAWGLQPVRYGNNIVAKTSTWEADRPTLMLNAHIDTVRPAASYTIDPYTPLLRDGRLYGLGSNDDGASVVALTSAFRSLRTRHLPYNLLLALSAEEEVGGEGGMRMLLPALAQEGIRIDAALVGEPTGMQPAIAERGLIVLDCVTHGVAGHAARNEGINAIYRAMDDINRLRDFRFDRTSEILGPVKVSITQIEAGKQHNTVPDTCRWVVDVRTTDAYSNEETSRLLCEALSPHTEAAHRSTRVQASVIADSHPLVKGAVALGRTPFVSPTTSDMSLMHGIPSLKMGPGDSSRSHRADEYILISEIAEAIDLYTTLLSNLTL